MNSYFLVAGGGALGALARFSLNLYCSGRWPGFPWATLAVNSAGCFVAGLLVGAQLSAAWMLFLATGFLGAFTTFSAFSAETWKLAAEAGWAMAALNIGANLVLSLLLAGLGIFLAHKFVA